MSIHDVPAPAFYPFGPDNHSALVVIAAVILFIYALIAIVFKTFIRFNLVSLRDYDIVLLVAFTIYFAQTILVIILCNHGLGRHRDTLSAAAYETFSKLRYTSRILGIVTDGLTKLSISLLIRQIDNSGRLNMINVVLGIVIVAWTIVGLFTMVFQCPLPTPWLVDNMHQCSRYEPIALFNGITNIVTDLCLCVLPAVMMWRVQTNVETKTIVVALFGCRIVVPLVTIPAVIREHSLAHHSADITWKAVTSTILFQVSIGLSVITACIPSLKSIVDSYLGSTAFAGIGTPYHLRESDHSRGLQITGLRTVTDRSARVSEPSPQNSGNNKKRRTLGYSVTASVKSTRQSLSSKIRGEDKDETNGGESVKGLTEGIIAARDADTASEKRDEPVSRVGSHDDESLDNFFAASR